MIPVYVLQCDELPERTRTIRAHLAEKGVPATFYRGFHGNTWGIDTRKEYESGRRISPGHVGLNLGVWALWQHVHLTPDRRGDDGALPVVVLEDDAVVPENFAVRLSDLEIRLNYDFPDWDLVFLGLAETEPHVWSKITERIGGPNSKLCRLDYPFGTHAIMLRRRALPVLMEHMRTAHKNLDQQLYERVLKPGHLKWCAVLPSMVTQRTFNYVDGGPPEWTTSTIDTDPAPVPPAHPAEIGWQGADDSELGWRGDPAPVPTTPELVAATLSVVDPNPCIYRGESTCDVGEARGGRTVPLYDCGRMGGMCFTSERDLTVGRWDVKSCKDCKVRTEMAPDSARERLPVPEGHFNPSICLFNGRLILATRDSWGHSKIALWELKNPKPDWSGPWQCDPIGSFGSTHPEASRLEDPRLFASRDPETGRESLCSMFNLPDGYPPKRVQVGYVRFAHDLSGITGTEVFRSPFDNLYEKNWVPFADDEGIHWVYSTKPEHTVLGHPGSGMASWTTPNPLPWVGGMVRGGACPVLVQSGPDWQHDRPGVYYHFFHGCLKRIQGTVYAVGCVVFEARPPYKVLRQTKLPLLWPDLPAVGENVVKRFILWPGGAVPHAGKWWLACGVDDTYVRIASLDFQTVEDALSDQPEEERIGSLRGTDMATGQRK